MRLFTRRDDAAPEAPPADYPKSYYEPRPEPDEPELGPQPERSEPKLAEPGLDDLSRHDWLAFV